jgi:predicted nucleic acid-binding protein
MKLYVPDTALLEFQVVLRSISRKPDAVSKALLALHGALELNGATAASTLDASLLVRQCEIEEQHSLSYFDSLIAASALRLNDGILSDDTSFDEVPTLTRIPLT